MDFFEHKELDALQIKQEQVQQKKHEYHLIGKTRKIPGLTLFSFNLVTGEIKPAAYEKSSTVDFISKMPVEKPKVVIEKHCVYRQALNKRNFIKRLRREGIILPKYEDWI